MNCAACGYSMEGNSNETWCPECRCTADRATVAEFAAVSRRTQKQAALFVPAAVAANVLLCPLAPIVVAMIAIPIAVRVSRASARRWAWTSRLATWAIGLGVWLSLALAPLALTMPIVIAWTSFR